MQHFSISALFFEFHHSICFQDFKVYVYSVSGSSIQQVKVIEDHKAEITDVAFSPDGTLLAVADANRRIVPYSYPELKVGQHPPCSWVSAVLKIFSQSLTL